MTRSHRFGPHGGLRNRQTGATGQSSMMEAVRRVALALAIALLAAGCTRSDASTPSARESSHTRPIPETPAASDTPSSQEPNLPRFAVSRIGPWQREALRKRNWHPGCPVGLDSLRWLDVTYLGFDGEVQQGPIVVNASVAHEVLHVFRTLLRASFPIKRIALPARYRPNAHNWKSTSDVTAAFNCRPATDLPGVWSQHAYGLAVDINPLENPYLRADGSVLRKAAKPYRDRSLQRPGMIHDGDVVVRAFDRIGWGWGGRWTTIKDYMHFSLSGT
jgi:D-alanyl-D-alanine carboxypeptidase-like protein